MNDKKISREAFASEKDLFNSSQTKVSYIEADKNLDNPDSINGIIPRSESEKNNFTTTETMELSASLDSPSSQSPVTPGIETQDTTIATGEETFQSILHGSGRLTKRLKGFSLTDCLCYNFNCFTFYYLSRKNKKKHEKYSS